MKPRKFHLGVGRSGEECLAFCRVSCFFPLPEGGFRRWPENLSLFFGWNTDSNPPKKSQRGTETDPGSESGVELGRPDPTADVWVDGGVGSCLMGIAD